MEDGIRASGEWSGEAGLSEEFGNLFHKRYDKIFKYVDDVKRGEILRDYEYDAFPSDKKKHKF